jgi:uncharacterized protein (TIGR02145 family)
MAENLKTTKFRDGTAIHYVTDGTVWAGMTTAAYCYWGNSTTNGSVYGGLYNFYAVIDNRGLCPTGWHVPSDSEWSTLRDYLGGENVAGGKLRETGSLHWTYSNNDVNNCTGFTALAGSWRGNDGSFYYNLGHAGWWWTSSILNSSSGALYCISGLSLVKGGGAYFYKNGGCSVRCIKD